ncbi:VCBS domain-containing protein [Sulfurimonas sp.]|uniref:VCBS domain-containing protein n=1 Tax=Sulfurimonas sp. TaxID=2022749 RepID=UPI002638D917|nr:VCBS domain-containing protein [Sulfurimonas sp.]MCW8895093.1 VCBS domain-containing protein [Sulfurimonas sp.]
MASGKTIGQVQVSEGSVKIIGIDGVAREPAYDGFIYEGEQIISVDPEALFQVKYTALPEATAYDGIFRVLTDGSVIAGADVMDSLASDKNLADIFNLETAAGEEAAEGSGKFTPSDIVAESSVQGFGRGPNPGLAGLDGVDVGTMDDQTNDNAPTAQDAFNTAMEDNPNNVVGQLLGHDADGNPFHFVLVDGPSEGSLILLPDGRYIYNTEDDFQDLGVGETRDVTFTYKTVETHTPEGFESDPATVTITVAGTNDQPYVADININGESTGGVVGYYDMNQGEGVSTQVESINAAGLDDIQLFHLSSAELEGIDTLYVQNPSNSSYGSEYLSQLGSIADAVNSGMTLIIHDRYVTGGSLILPDGGSIVFHRYFGNDDEIEIIDDDLETGVGGDIDDTSLDGGTSSNHGYVDLESLPEGAEVLMTDGDPSHVVTFAYTYGEGTVIYSTIPLDYYLNNGGPSNVVANMKIYAANLLEDFVNTYNIIYETHDDTDVPLVDDTTDDGNNVLTGELSVYDVDTNDTHVFVVDEESITIDSPVDVTIESITLTDNAYEDATPHSANYEIVGNFGALAAGETATVTVNYYAVDDSGVGTDPANPYDESDTSEPATITFTITGTNDQPIVSDINANGEEVSLWSLVASGATLATIEALAEMGISNTGSSPTDGSAIKFTLTSAANETVSFNWDFFDAENDSSYYNDFSFVVIDGVLTTLEDVFDTDVNGNTILSHTFTTAGTHTITFGVMNSGDTVVDSALNIQHVSGGTVTDIQTVGNVSQEVIIAATAIYESHDDDAYQNGVDDTQDDVLTTFNASLATAQDDDTNDTHEYFLSAETADVASEAIDPALITGLNVVVDTDGDYTVTGNFNALAAGETATVTFDYYAVDNNGVGTGTDNDESSISEPKTVTLTITGTNDQPIVSDISEELLETTSSGDPLTDFDQTDVLTTFAGTLSETLVDDDFNDLHTYHMNGEPSVTGAPGVTDLNIEVNSDGSYTMSGNFNALAAGQTATVSFDYYALDNSGAPLDGDSNNEASMSEVKTVTITVTGTNDAPEITDSTNPNIFNGLNGEYYGIGSQIHSLADFQAKILDQDPDATFRATNIDYGELGITTHGFSNGDTYHVSTDESLQTFLKADAHTLSADPGNTSDGGVRLTGQVELDAGEYTFKILSDDGYQIIIDGTAVATRTANQSPQTHYHSFSLDSDGFHDIEIYWWDQGIEYIFQPELKIGNIEAEGEYIAFSSENFDFRAEAAASVIEAGTTDSGVVVDGIPTVSGDLDATDEDNGAILTWSVIDPSDTYGTFTIDSTTGTWTYTLNNDLPATEALNENQIVTEVFNVLVTDEHGATDTQPVVVEIQGTNDAPTLSVFGGDNLVVNGSFENPDISSGTWAHFATGVPGWVAADQVEIWDHLSTYGYAASDGDQHAELDYNGVVDTLSQTLNLKEGKFILNFDAATRDAATKDNAFIVLWNGTQIASITEADMHETDGTWKTFTFEVDAVDGANTLMFAEESSDNYGPLLDNVQLYAATSFNETTSGIVGNVVGDDVDAGAVLTYSLDNDYGIFDIDNNGSIFVKDGQSLDYELAPSYNLDVRVTDQFGASDMKTLEVSVNDITGVVTANVSNLVSQDFSNWDNEGWSWDYTKGGFSASGDWDLSKNKFGPFDENTVVHREFDLGSDYANLEVSVEFDLILNQPGKYYSWNSNDSIEITANDSAQTLYATSGDGVYHVVMQVIADEDGKVDVSLDSNTKGGDSWAEVWYLDNFEINFENQTLTFDTSAEGTIDVEALVDQANDFDLDNDTSTIETGIPDSLDEIDLTVGNHDLSNITLADVIELSDADNVLKITGDAGDSVNDIAANGWVVDTSPTVTESGYNTYTNVADTSVQLLIDIEIPIDVD